MSSQQPLIYRVSPDGSKAQVAGSIKLTLQIGVRPYDLVLPPYSDDALSSVIFQLTVIFDTAIPGDLKLRNAEMCETMAVLVMQLGAPWDQGLMDAMANRKGAGHVMALKLLVARASPDFAMQASRALAAMPVSHDEAVDLMREATSEELRSFWWQNLLARQCDASVLLDTALVGPEEFRESARDEIERRHATGFGPEHADSPLIAIAMARDATELAACIDRYSRSRTFSRLALDQAIAYNPRQSIKAAAWALARLAEASPPVAASTEQSGPATRGGAAN